MSLSFLTFILHVFPIFIGHPLIVVADCGTVKLINNNQSINNLESLITYKLYCMQIKNIYIYETIKNT
jgi:hypothetical protein